MPPKSKTKQAPVFEPDFASAREKRVSELRLHHHRQFNYREVAHPPLSDLLDERNWCHPEQTTDKGRVLVADMDFKPGDVVFREKPLVSASWNDFHCHECAKPHQNLSCRTFQGIYGKNTKLATNMVKLEDLLLEYGVIGDLDRARLFIKALWLLKLAPDASCWAEISKLTTAGTMQEEYTFCIDDFRKKTMVREAGLIDDSVTSFELTKLLAILNNNSHEIEGFGSGIWLYASLLEHSCTANCNFVTSEEELILVAIKHIKAGSPLSIDYNIATYKPYAFRQSHYHAHYGFTCSCEMCTTSYDRPRAFHCPQSIRYYAHFVQQIPQLNGSFCKGQLGPQQNNPGLFSTFALNTTTPMLNTQALTIGANNLYNDIAQYVARIQAATPTSHIPFQSAPEQSPTTINAGCFQTIVNGLYSFNGVQIDLKTCPYLTTTPNPACPPFDSPTGKCLDGVVYPIGDGLNGQQWTCSGCGYVLTPEEIALCTQQESIVSAPPNVAQGDTYEDVQELFSSHGYTVPTLQQVSQLLSQGVMHVSHTVVYWTLYVLALSWTKRATDSCYVLETTATKQSQKVSKGLSGSKLRRAKSQAKTTKLVYPEDTLTEAELDTIDFNNRSALGFFSLNYEPHAHTAETLQKQRRDAVQLQESGMAESDLSPQDKQQLLMVSKATDTIIPNNVELPLLSEHLWSIIAESATRNLHPLHPELIIISDYLAQVQILKRRSKRAQAIWYYCYELSNLVNSRISRETYRIKRLVTHTPRTIAQLQHHYQTIDELYQQMIFHNEDTTAMNILKQFTLTALDSDSDDDELQPQAQIPTPNGAKGNNDGDHDDDDNDDDDDDDAEDADELFLNSALAQGLLQKSLQAQNQEVAKANATTARSSQQPTADSMGIDSSTTSAAAAPRRASDPNVLRPSNPFSNSFGFSSSALFADKSAGPGLSGFGQQQPPLQGQTTTFGSPQPPQTSPNPFASISASGFASPTPSQQQQQPPQSTAFGSGFAFGSSFNPQFTGFSPTKTAAEQSKAQEDVNQSLPTDPFAGINFGPPK